MSPLAIILTRPTSGLVRVSRATLPVFALTIFVSALLLFALEPMFTKLALPLLGGSPSVWSVAMVFFQVLMLAGYSTAHALTRWVPLRVGAAIHTVVLLLAFATLPIGLHADTLPPAGADPTLWLIGVLGSSIGLPFFALSVHGPLLQAWFARTGHRQAGDPYFLYAASNLGSFAALLAYPLAIEPLVGLSAQGAASTALFLLLVALVLASAWLSLGPTLATPSPAQAANAARPDAAQVSGWILRAFVPSALLVSVTVHVSTDIAAAPLLWVLPLGLYLMTFVVAFRDGAPGDRSLAVLLAWAATLALVMLGLPSKAFGLNLIVQLGAFASAALMCHRALYRSRPDASGATGFYFAMALGSALGGLFAGIAAPLLFSSVVEYSVLLVAALACLPGTIPALRRTRVGAWLGPALAVVGVLAVAHAIYALTHAAEVASKLGFAGLGTVGLLLWRRADARLLVAGALALQLTVLPALGPASESYRSFFGVNRVGLIRDGQFRTLVHGNIMHGAIRIREADGSPSRGTPKPATYYAKDGPIGDAIRAARETHGGRLQHIAVVGLGAGALACHAEAQEALTFYEIDPVVVRLAQDRARFRYLADCAPQATIVTGDARLRIAGQTAQSDVIVIDAFSSDAIPIHLLTREALALDLTKLDPHGLLVLHISNNTMEFSGIVARTAADLGLVTFVRNDVAVSPDHPDLRTPSEAAVLARRSADLGPLLDHPDLWRKVEPDWSMRPWTDDYSTILTPLAAKWLAPR